MYQNTEPARYWQQQLAEWGPKVLFAILILIVTHFVAKAVQWGLAKLVDRMPVLKRHPGVGGDSIGAELGRLAYWLVWLVGLIAALQPLGLSGVLTPVTALTNEVFAFLPRILGAGLFFFAGLILARIVRHVVEAALGALNLERLASRAGLKLGDAPVAVDSEGTASEGVAPARSTIARAVGMTVSAVIIIFAAIASLDILQIQAVSEPAKNMLNMIALAIPNVLAALLTLIAALMLLVERPVAGTYLFVDDLNVVFIVLSAFVGQRTGVGAVSRGSGAGRTAPALSRASAGGAASS